MSASFRHKPFIIQAIVFGFLFVLLIFLYPFKTSFSFLLGGLICIIPNLLFSRIFFQKKGIRKAKNVVLALYFGELVKIIATIFLFILIFKRFAIDGLFLFLGYIIALILYWVILATLTKK